MKKLTVSLIFLIIASTVNAQDYSDLKQIPLKDSIQCKNAEVKVLECSNHLLSKPYGEDLKSVHASLFLLEWMEQTPDYIFSFDDKLYNSIKSDLILSSRYLASQCKIAIIDKPKEYDSDFQYKHISVFLEYCEDPKNNVKLNSKIKKLIEAKHSGKLKEVLAEK